MTVHHKPTPIYGKALDSKALRAYKRTQHRIESGLNLSPKHAPPESDGRCGETQPPVTLWVLTAARQNRCHGSQRDRYDKAVTHCWLPANSASGAGLHQRGRPRLRVNGAGLQAEGLSLNAKQLRSGLKKSQLGLTAALGLQVQKSLAVGPFTSRAPARVKQFKAFESELLGCVLVSPDCALMIGRRELSALLRCAVRGLTPSVLMGLQSSHTVISSGLSSLRVPRRKLGLILVNALKRIKNNRVRQASIV